MSTILGTDLFAFNLNYNDIADVNKKLYNGNISQTLWRTANTDNSLKDYEYTHDALNRITGGVDDSGYNNLTSVAYKLEKKSIFQVFVLHKLYFCALIHQTDKIEYVKKVFSRHYNLRNCRRLTQGN